MKDRRPQVLEEIRPRLFDFLHRIYFETKITLYLGLMDSPVMVTSEFGSVTACSRKFRSLDFEDICDAFAEEIGNDLLRIETSPLQKTSPITKYGLYLYQLQSPDYIDIIRYAKQVG